MHHCRTGKEAIPAQILRVLEIKQGFLPSEQGIQRRIARSSPWRSGLQVGGAGLPVNQLLACSLGQSRSPMGPHERERYRRK